MPRARGILQTSLLFRTAAEKKKDRERGRERYGSRSLEPGRTKVDVAPAHTHVQTHTHTREKLAHDVESRDFLPRARVK